MQKSVYECTTSLILEQMSYSNGGQLWVLLQETEATVSMALTKLNSRSLENIGLSDLSEGCVIVTHLDGRCVNTGGVNNASGGVMVCEIFLWHILGPLVPAEHCLSPTAYLSIAADRSTPISCWLLPAL